VANRDELLSREIDSFRETGCVVQKWVDRDRRMDWIDTWTNEIYIDTKAKCRHLKFFSLDRDFAAGVYLSDLLHPVTHCKRTIVHVLIHTRKGEERTREKVRGATVQKAGSKIPT
jgi:hypothetical protein